MTNGEHVMKSIGERPVRGGNNVVTVPPTSSIVEVIEQLATHNIGVVVIIDDAGRAIGVLSERDVIKALAASGADILAWTADQLMTKSIVSCSPSDGLFAAVTRMLDHGIRHLLIVDDGELQGVVAIRDLLSELVKKERTERELLVELVGAIHQKIQSTKASAPLDDAVQLSA